MVCQTNPVWESTMVCQGSMRRAPSVCRAALLKETSDTAGSYTAGLNTRGRSRKSQGKAWHLFSTPASDGPTDEADADAGQRDGARLRHDDQFESGAGGVQADRHVSHLRLRPLPIGQIQREQRGQIAPRSRRERAGNRESCAAKVGDQKRIGAAVLAAGERPRRSARPERGEVEREPTARCSPEARKIEHARGHVEQVPRGARNTGEGRQLPAIRAAGSPRETGRKGLRPGRIAGREDGIRTDAHCRVFMAAWNQGA